LYRIKNKKKYKARGGSRMGEEWEKNGRKKKKKRRR